MIPKIIHYCWLSKDPYPAQIKRCIASWKKVIPDYEFILWDWEKCQSEGLINTWVKEAFESKKYAFAADYIRLYAVYKYGGIYLDTDVEVIKPYDDFLHLPYFIGTESNHMEYLECATFGAAPETQWIKLCLAYYENRHFILPNGKFDVEKQAPEIIKKLLSNHFESIIRCTQIPLSYDKSDHLLHVFHYSYFCPKSYFTRRIRLKENTYSIHQYATSWRTPWQKLQIYTNFGIILAKQKIQCIFHCTPKHYNSY